MLGIDEGSPRQLLTHVDVEDREQVAAALEHTLTTGQALTAECWVDSPGGRRFVRHHAEAVRGVDGRAVRLVGTVQDLTGHKRLEDQLLQSQKLESIGRLAGGVAHDFNNLLTVINGYSEVLLAEIDEKNPTHAALVEISKAGERAAALASQLLAFSRKHRAQAAPVCLNSVVTDAERMLRRLLGEDIEIVTELEPNLGIVKADPGLLQQVLVNLAVNARDAMPEGGKMIIATANVMDAPGPLVTLTVADTGCGMDPATQAHIFEPFFTTKPKGRGTGLGLSTVYGIVQQCGGWIAVDSVLNQGTAFRIFLPQVNGR
jgi:signal transduction histidine kinase